jgi:hypothetical protein
MMIFLCLNLMLKQLPTYPSKVTLATEATSDVSHHAHPGKEDPALMWQYHQTEQMPQNSHIEQCQKTPTRRLLPDAPKMSADVDDDSPWFSPWNQVSSTTLKSH